MRPILEFDSVIWSPHYKCHIKTIENVQNKFLRYIYFKFRQKCNFPDIEDYHIPIDFVRNHLNLPTLEKRRTDNDLIFLYKILNNLCSCPKLLEKINLRIPSGSLRHNNLFDPQFTTKDFIKNSPLYRIQYSFNEYSKNNSSLDIFNDTLTKFKSKIGRYNINY